VNDPSDKLEITIDVLDCAEYAGAIDPPYRVRMGQDYDITLFASGFDDSEHVEGTAGGFYTITFNL
jgi:hypothetical protein